MHWDFAMAGVTTHLDESTVAVSEIKKQPTRFIIIEPKYLLELDINPLQVVHMLLMIHVPFWHFVVHKVQRCYA